jgi:Flp pilus assembly protein TadG
MAASVLFLTISGIIELSMVMFLQSLVEGGLREASRYGITGDVPVGVTREARITEIVQENLIGLIPMANVTITYKVYPSFGDVGKPEPFVDASPVNGKYDAGETYTDINGNGQWDADMGAAGLGNAGDIVLYTINADWPLITPMVAPLFGHDGKVTISASVAVRNEPYPIAETP